MKTYHFDCQRERDATCKAAVVGGEIQAGDAREAWGLIASMLCVPGKWTCRVRCGRRWLKTRTYNVRIPTTRRSE